MTSDPDTPSDTAGVDVDGVDVDAIAGAVQRCSGVSGLYAGAFGEIGTYLPGRRVAGVQIADDEVTVQVRIGWGVTIADAGAQIRAALVGLTGGRRVNIVIADVDDPPEDNAPDQMTPEPTPLAAVSPVSASAGPAEVAEAALPVASFPPAPVVTPKPESPRLDVTS